MNISVKIEKAIPLTIFDEPVLQEQMDHLFNDAQEKLKARFNEILTFLDSDFTCEELPYDKIIVLFKGYFCKLILNQAVEITFTNRGKYDVLSNILSLLSKEKMEAAIMGKPMISAFEVAIGQIPTNDAFSAALNGSKMLLLEQKFLGRTIFPTFEKEKNQ